MKLRREINFETEKIVVRDDLIEFNWSHACAASVPKVTAEQAAILIGEETEHVYRRADCGQGTVDLSATLSLKNPVVERRNKRAGSLHLMMRPFTGPLRGTECQHICA